MSEAGGLFCDQIVDFCNSFLIMNDFTAECKKENSDPENSLENANPIVPVSYAGRAAETFPRAELVILEGIGGIICHFSGNYDKMTVIVQI